MKQPNKHPSVDTTASRTLERRSRLRTLLPGLLTVGLGAILVNAGCAQGEDIGEGPFDSGALGFPSGGAVGSGASSGAGGYAAGAGGFVVVGSGGAASGSGGTGAGGGATGSGGMGGATNAGGSTAGATSTGGATGGTGGKSTGGASSGGASSGGASSGGASSGGAPTACPNGDADADGMCDDDEDSDGDDWTDKAVFNGVHVIQGGQCGASGDCGRIDTRAEISSCLDNPDEEKDQYAGWDWNDQDNGICDSGYGWAPPWAECHDNWAAQWQGCIHLTGNGPHCFAIDGGTDEACTTLFFDGATSPNARSGGGVQCVTAAPGNYPILWAYTMDGGSSAGMHLRYCDAAGGATCTPSQAIPASMLRTTCP